MKKQWLYGLPAVLLAVAVASAIALSACSSPVQEQGPTGTITISLGGTDESRARWVFPPDDDMLEELLHNVELTCTGHAPVRINGKKIGDTITATVAEGIWTVTVRAYLDGELYAESTGTDWVDVKAGQNNGVTVQMYKAFEDPCDHGGGWEWTITTALNLATGIGVATETCADCGAARGDPRTFTTADNTPPGLVLTQGATYSVGSNTTSPPSGAVVIPGWVREADGTFVQITTIANNAFNANTTITGVTIHEGVTSIGTSAFNGCTGLTSVTIPQGITSIGDNAFRNSGLTSVIIPGGVTLGIMVFRGNASLTSVTIQNGVTSISTQTFQDCTSLTSVTIPSSVTSIDQQAFAGTGLTSVIIPEGVTSIGSSAFNGCTSLSSVTIPSSVTSIDQQAFSGCTSLTDVTLRANLTSIEMSTFRNCSSLTSITIPAGVRSIGAYAFMGAGLTSVILPDGLESIAMQAFSGTGLTSITIPSSVTSTTQEVFMNCASLASVTIEGVTTFGTNIFLNSPSLYMVTFREAGVTFGDNTASPFFVNLVPVYLLPPPDGGAGTYTRNPSDPIDPNTWTKQP